MFVFGLEPVYPVRWNRYPAPSAEPDNGETGLDKYNSHGSSKIRLQHYNHIISYQYSAMYNSTYNLKIHYIFHYIRSGSNIKNRIFNSKQQH